MAEPFWQRSLDTISYADLVEFVDEEHPEDEHIEYKGASYKQNGLPEFTEKVLSSLVAFANTSGGMLFYGVDENETTKLHYIEKGIEAWGTKGAKLRDPAIPLVGLCAQEIYPRISIETKSIEIGDGDHQGNKILLVRVRPGSQPPYALKNRYIYIRTGEAEELATVAEIEALIRRRVDTVVGAVTPDRYIDLNVFGYAVNPPQDRPPCFMVSLEPAFPMTPVPPDWQSDEAFQGICTNLYGRGNFIQRLPDGIIYAPFIHPEHREETETACAFTNGSIGVRKRIMETREPVLEIVRLWRILRKVLTDASAWPRQVGHYGGPLVCRMAMASITELRIMVDPVAINQAVVWTQDIEPGFENRFPRWDESVEWSAGTHVDDIVEFALQSLTRQLQFPSFHTLKEQIRAAADP